LNNKPNLILGLKKHGILIIEGQEDHPAVTDANSDLNGIVGEDINLYILEGGYLIGNSGLSLEHPRNRLFRKQLIASHLIGLPVQFQGEGPQLDPLQDLLQLPLHGRLDC